MYRAVRNDALIFRTIACTAACIARGESECKSREARKARDHEESMEKQARGEELHCAIG